MNRRTFLTTTGLAGIAATAGCLSSLTSSGPQVPPLVEDRPDAVYIPSHIEGMAMAGMGMAGEFHVGLSFSYPHRFWLVTGSNTRMVEIAQSDTLHLMASVWDMETGTVLPSNNLSAEIEKEGEPVTSKRMWPMLSQNMGFHYGDNYVLDGDGTYDVTVAVDPVQERLTGAFDGRFAEGASTTISFEFTEPKLNEVTYRTLPDRQGERAAIAGMEMEMMPMAGTPSKADMPGTLVGEGSSGDATILATRLDEPPAGIDAAGPYLAVTAATPYNGYPLPFMAVDATVERGGSSVFDGALRATLDPDLGYHYGAAVEGLQSGDSVTLSFPTPPQVARHEGYETAFVGMEDVSMTVP